MRRFRHLLPLLAFVLIQLTGPSEKPLYVVRDSVVSISAGGCGGSTLAVPLTMLTTMGGNLCVLESPKEVADKMRAEP